MRQSAMGQDLRAGWGHDVAIATAIGLFLAVIGPYGSYLNGPFWQRLLFQLPCSWLGVVLIGLGVRLALARFRRGVALWVSVAVIAALAMGPVTLLNMVLAQAIWPLLSRYMTPLKWYREGLLIAEPASFAFTWLGLQRLGRQSASRPAEVSHPSPSRLAQIAPQPREVLCLQMEDHYVRVHTAQGSRLVMATFAEAQAAMAGAPGLRVHRSWWVADAAVIAAERDGRRLVLALANGVKAPVARSCVADVRARGWLGCQSGQVGAGVEGAP